MTPVHGPKQTPALFVGCVFALLALGGGAFRWFQPATTLPEVEIFWIPDVEEARAYIASDGPHPATETESGEGVLEAFQVWNRLVPHGDLEQKRRVTTQLEERARRFHQQHGAAAYRALGMKAWSNFSRSLQGQDPDGTVAWGGGIVEEASRTGLRDDKGQWKEGSWLLLRMLFIQGWSAVLRHSIPVDTLMHPLERQTIPKWKAEAHQDWVSLPWKSRLRYATEARKLDPSYPVHFIRGMIFSRAGLFPQALTELELATERKERVKGLEGWLKALRRTQRAGNEP